MTSSDAKTIPKSDFLAAEDIKEILRGREKAEQERIVRWVSESLELSGAAVRPRPEHSHPTANAAQDPEPARPSQDTARTKDIRSFAQEKQPKNDIQFVAVVAYYYRFVSPEGDRKDAITSGDLQTAARLAQRAVFKTPSVTLNNAVQQGYMDRAARGAYRVNAVGENLVSMTLPGAGGEGTSNKKVGRRRTSKTEAKKGSKKSSKSR
jgi:hypothetical protein